MRILRQSELIEGSAGPYVIPAIGLCRCGNKVHLRGFTNQCSKCKSYYNWAGQELCDPQLWGEETGEDPVDILRIP